MWTAPAEYEPARLIGDHECGRCHARLFDHCAVHAWLPCCPGTCPGLPRPPGGNRGGGRPKNRRN